MRVDAKDLGHSGREAYGDVLRLEVVAGGDEEEDVVVVGGVFDAFLYLVFAVEEEEGEGDDVYFPLLDRVLDCLKRP